MAIADIESLKKNVAEFCKSNPKKISFLSKINGRLDYKGLASVCSIKHANNCIPWLTDAFGRELIIKNEKGFYDKCPLLKNRDIGSLVRQGQGIRISSPIVRKKLIKNIKNVEDYFKKYVLSNFESVDNYFNKDSSVSISSKKIEEAFNKVLVLLQAKTTLPEIAGLNERFFLAFNDYFGQTRAMPSQMLNKFTAIIHLYEPIVKKYFLIEKNDETKLKSSLNEDMISLAYGINDKNFKLKETEDSYWAQRSQKESSIRIAFKYRNIESHGATKLKSYDMDKIVYYVFLAILYLYI
jgi:hypothetical protein